MDINHLPKLTRYIRQAGLLSGSPFFLVDVGVSGGIDQYWREFGDELTAVGFDPLVNEIARLNEAEQSAAVQYIASLVGTHSCSKEPPGVFHTDNPEGSSTEWTRKLLAMNYANSYYDYTHTGVSTAQLLELDEFFQGRFTEVDFIKTDTDGHDIDVLRGGRNLLAAAGPIGLEVEVSFLGAATPDANLFSNIDPFLRELGYSVFAIEPRFHTRAELPGMFRWCQPADTHTGQLIWGNALFFRDVCLPGYEKRFGFDFTPVKLLKLCCAYEIFGLVDCAAQTLVHFRDRIHKVVDVDRCLDLLTPPLPDKRQVSYRAYIEFFKNNIEDFYSGC